MLVFTINLLIQLCLMNPRNSNQIHYIVMMAYTFTENFETSGPYEELDNYEKI